MANSAASIAPSLEASSKSNMKFMYLPGSGKDGEVMTYFHYLCVCLLLPLLPVQCSRWVLCISVPAERKQQKRLANQPAGKENFSLDVRPHVKLKKSL